MPIRYTHQLARKFCINYINVHIALTPIPIYLFTEVLLSPSKCSNSKINVVACGYVVLSFEIEYINNQYQPANKGISKTQHLKVKETHQRMINARINFHERLRVIIRWYCQTTIVKSIRW